MCLLLRRTFEAGLEITGWVILGHPIQVLIFAPVATRVLLAALRTLAALNVVIREAPGERARAILDQPGKNPPRLGRASPNWPEMGGPPLHRLAPRH